MQCIFRKQLTTTGKLGTDVIKSLRLFTFPFQLLSMFQDRVEKVLNNARNKVPETRQQNAPPSDYWSNIGEYKVYSRKWCIIKIHISL